MFPREKDLQLRWRWSSLTHREGLSLIEANLKTSSLRNKKADISRRHNCFPSLSDMTRPKNKPRNSILMMCHPDLSSAFVWLKICYIQVYLFTTFWHFVWLAFVHAQSSIGLGTTLESGASPGTSPETGRASASHWRPLREGRPTLVVQGACWPWRR